MPHPRTRRGGLSERAAVVGLISGRGARSTRDRSLDELKELANAAGASVVLTVMQERARPDPAMYIGRGKLDELQRACDEMNVDVVIVDHELTPSQLRQMEARLGVRVVDRTQLILDIFARRARTREGRLQVELAQLKYLLPRLVGRGPELSRLGGGIGTRGPGETQLETDRRRIRDRIVAIGRDIESIRRHRSLARDRRQRASTPTVALVGYTNAGKSTLFNRLTREQTAVSDALFVTLDPLVRQVRLPDRREILLTDTVGFIDRLPHTLVAAFRATLEHIAQADLLLHVIDASSVERKRQISAVERVLDEVGAGEVPILTVLNKCDKLPDSERDRLQLTDPDAICISALTGQSVSELAETMASRLALDKVRLVLEFDAAEPSTAGRIARIYRHGRVLGHVATDGRVSVEVDIPRRLVPILTGRPDDDAVPVGISRAR
jgi:GTP-binding protein HflX